MPSKNKKSLREQQRHSTPKDNGCPWLQVESHNQDTAEELCSKVTQLQSIPRAVESVSRELLVDGLKDLELHWIRVVERTS